MTNSAVDWSMFDWTVRELTRDEFNRVYLLEQQESGPRCWWCARPLNGLPICCDPRAMHA